MVQVRSTTRITRMKSASFDSSEGRRFRLRDNSSRKGSVKWPMSTSTAIGAQGP